MDPVTGAVVIAGITVAGKPSAELVKEFLGRLIFPSASAAGEALAHPIAEWQKQRSQRASQLLMDAAVIVNKSGNEPRPVPGRVLMPILERGSLEENEDLQRKWANLLASAATYGDEVPPSFPAILAELSPHEAQTLDYIAATWPESIELSNFYKNFAAPFPALLIALENLQRLRLIKLISGAAPLKFTTFVPGRHTSIYQATFLGQHLAGLCQYKKAKLTKTADKSLRGEEL